MGRLERLQPLGGRNRRGMRNPENLEAMADALMSVGYTPNSGGMGALAMMASAGAGAFLQNRADRLRRTPEIQRAGQLPGRMQRGAGPNIPQSIRFRNPFGGG